MKKKYNQFGMELEPALDKHLLKRRNKMKRIVKYILRDVVLGSYYCAPYRGETTLSNVRTDAYMFANKDDISFLNDWELESLSGRQFEIIEIIEFV